MYTIRTANQQTRSSQLLLLTSVEMTKPERKVKNGPFSLIFEHLNFSGKEFSEALTHGLKNVTPRHYVQAGLRAEWL